MTVLLLALLDKAKLWLALAGGVVLAAGVALVRGYAAGRSAQRVAQAKAVEKSRRRVQKNRVRAGTATDEELNRELGKWSRD